MTLIALSLACLISCMNSPARDCALFSEASSAILRRVTATKLHGLRKVYSTEDYTMSGLAPEYLQYLLMDSGTPSSISFKHIQVFALVHYSMS